jgi:uncharacterized repeat protein (TIGR01451 family)
MLMGFPGVGRRRTKEPKRSLVGRTAWGLGLALLLTWTAELQAQATPAGTVISSTSQATFQDPDGQSFAVLSNTVDLTVGQVAAVDLAPPRASTSDPGATVFLPHTLRNIGNGTDSFTVSARSQTGWPVTIYRDVNANGSLDSGDQQVAGPISLSSGATAALLVTVSIPGLATVRGTTDSLWVTGTSLVDPTAADSLEDLVQIRSVGIAVVLDKSVDRVSATPGDVLTYSINYQATGSATASNLRISDVIPQGSSYIAGTLRLNGAPLSDVSGDDAGSFEAAANRVVVTLATVSGGDTGTVRFQVRVGP